MISLIFYLIDLLIELYFHNLVIQTPKSFCATPKGKFEITLNKTKPYL